MVPAGMSTGGGSVEMGSEAANKGGTNSLGGFVFGDYSPAESGSSVGVWMPWVVLGACVIGGLFILKGGK